MRERHGFGGRAVVPEVCRTSARSSVRGGVAGACPRVSCRGAIPMHPLASGVAGRRRATGIPRDCAAATAGGSSSAGAISASILSADSNARHAAASSEGSSGTQVAKLIAPSIATAVARRPLGNAVATRLPRPIPIRASEAPKRSTSPWSSAYESMRPSPSPTAGADGCRRPCHASTSSTVATAGTSVTAKPWVEWRIDFDTRAARRCTPVHRAPEAYNG